MSIVLQDEDADKLTRLCAWRSKDDSTSSARTQGQTGGKGARAGYCRMNMHYGNSPSDVELHVALMPSGLVVCVSDALLPHQRLLQPS